MRRYFCYSCLLLIALLTGGCVTTGTYEQKADEARLLGDTVKALESEYAGLMKQKEGLVLEKKELTQNLTASLQQSADLQQDLVRARADSDRLERVLSARSQETGQALAEMRQDIDRLENDNRQLQQQVEAERLAREARLAEVKNTYDELVSKMESEITRGEITISDLQGRLTVNMVERILFDSGRADVKPAGLEVLRRIGEIVGGVKEKEIRVEGHSDNVPISPRLAQTFPSNWELSTARATNVVHFLQDEVGIAGEKLSACGFSEFRPVADNVTSEGRAQNRRIQIVLVPIEERVEATTK